MTAKTVPLRDYTDLLVRHERELREANERATALALALQVAQAAHSSDLRDRVLILVVGVVGGAVASLIVGAIR